MHELFIAASVVEELLDFLENQGATRVVCG